MSYKLFLVEDEIVTRDGIRTSVNWADAGFQWSGEASDGELALALIEAEQPDILITDIRMPFMDGLELSRIVRERFPRTRIVILSGHDEFRYAQEALQLGATEYLLKPVSAQDLLGALARVSAQLDREHQQEEQLSRLQSRLDDNLNVMRQRFLVDVVTGRLLPSVAVDEAQRVQIDLVARNYLAMIVRCQVTREMPHLARLEAYHSVRQRVADCLSAWPDLLFFIKDVEETGLIIKGDTPAIVQATAQRLAAQLTALLHTDDDLDGGLDDGVVIGVGAGRLAQRLGELPQSFLDAFDAAKMQTRQFARHELRITISPQQLLALDPTAAITFLRQGNLKEVDAFLETHLAAVHSDDVHLHALAEFLVTDLLVATAAFVQEFGGAPEDIMPVRDELTLLLAEGDSVPKLRALMRRLLTQALLYRDRHTDRTRHLVEQAKHYIQLNLTSDDISLHTVADSVGWSPSHFSAVFSREVGETFIEYLTRQRMLKARELLRMTPLSTAEVGRQVGYNNPRYFYAVFRKATGQTPTEFRQNRSGEMRNTLRDSQSRGNPAAGGKAVDR